MRFSRVSRYLFCSHLITYNSRLWILPLKCVFFYDVRLFLPSHSQNWAPAGCDKLDKCLKGPRLQSCEVCLGTLRLSRSNTLFILKALFGNVSTLKKIWVSVMWCTNEALKILLFKSISKCFKEVKRDLPYSFSPIDCSVSNYKP